MPITSLAGHESKPKDASVKVLVVEDNAVIAMLLHMMVTDAGYEPIGPVATADAALALLDREGLPDVAVLDVDLGDHDSKPVYDRLKLARIPALMLTGHGELARGLGFEDAMVLDKPIEPEDLKIALDQLAQAASG